MTIRFAPARRRGLSAIVNSRGMRFRLQASNDNKTTSLNDEVLAAALRHFASHGMAAAERARDCAEAARLQSDDAQCAWWLNICRTLDRRMADAYSRRIASAQG